LEQKEKQMKHLIETNKRAEVLLIRNAELESLLYSLQVEKESRNLQIIMMLLVFCFHLDRCYNVKDSKDSSNTEPIDDSSSFTSELGM
jgi:hypothetical protein